MRVATAEQLARFEQFKRSKFPRAAMKKLMGDMVGSSSERCAIVLARSRPTWLIMLAAAATTPDVRTVQASLAKTLVGELVETAKQQMTAHGQSVKSSFGIFI